MLVLSRKEGEWVEVTHRAGDVLRICVSRLWPGKVRIGFDDPARDFEVVRTELLDGRPSGPIPMGG